MAFNAIDLEKSTNQFPVLRFIDSRSERNADQEEEQKLHPTR